jgi:iron complex outermembrane receptor protein
VSLCVFRAPLIDDVQTGITSMNLVSPIEVIKRIEIIKGQQVVLWSKCFTGAVNIVTKDSLDNDAHYVFRRVLWPV